MSTPNGMLRVQVSDGTAGVADAFAAAITGIDRFDASRTATGEIVSLWEPMGETFRGMMVEHWQTQGRISGTPWVFYTEAEAIYAIIKEGIYGRPITVHDLNRWIPGREILFPSFIRQSHSKHIFIGGKRRLRMGSAVEHAGDIHAGRGRIPRQLGGIGGRRPPRPLLVISPEMKRRFRLDMTVFAGKHTSALGRRISKAEVVRTRGGRLLQ